MKYQCLPVEIVQNGGHHYRQLWRDEYAAIYEQRNAFRTLLGYEVITLKRQGPCRVFGKLYPAKEIYPCSEGWGTLGVSVSDFERAMAIAQVLSEVAKQKVKDCRQNDLCRSRIGRGRPGKGQAGRAVPAWDKDQGPGPVLEVASK